MQPCKAKYMWAVWNIIALLIVQETTIDKSSKRFKSEAWRLKSISPINNALRQLCSIETVLQCR